VNRWDARFHLPQICCPTGIGRVESIPGEGGVAVDNGDRHGGLNC